MNPVRYFFYAPFYLIWFLWHSLCLLPVPYRLVVVGVLLSGLVVASFTEAGPMRIAVICRRFSWIGIPVTLFVLWWLWCTFLFVKWPDTSTVAVVFSGFMLLLGLVWTVFTERVILRNHWNKGIISRGIRRIRFRLRWDSIAKACGMAHERDVRPHDWLTGGTSIIRQRALAVQWVPTLWHGRRGADDSTQYLIRPARGLSAKHWTDPKDGSNTNELTLAIAIAAKAYSCSISPSGKSNWWTLTMFWTNPANYRPRLED